MRSLAHRVCVYSSRRKHKDRASDSSLIDRCQVLFLGPTASIDDGCWLSDSTVVLVGWEMCYDCPEEAYIPVVRKVNVFTGETVEYDYTAAFPHYNSGFLQQKFPEIIFD